MRVKLTNKLSQSTAIHFHGLELPNDQDGVPFITQPPVKPGDSYTYEFTVPNAGSHMYHSPPWRCDTLNIAPGERWDVLVRATNPGTWAFHCHILPHAESDHGMFGMVMALVVQKAGVA